MRPSNALLESYRELYHYWATLFTACSPLPSNDIVGRSSSILFYFSLEDDTAAIHRQQARTAKWRFFILYRTDLDREVGS